MLFFTEPRPPVLYNKSFSFPGTWRPIAVYLLTRTVVVFVFNADVTQNRIAGDTAPLSSAERSFPFHRNLPTARYVD